LKNAEGGFCYSRKRGKKERKPEKPDLPGIGLFYLGPGFTVKVREGSFLGAAGWLSKAVN